MSCRVRLSSTSTRKIFRQGKFYGYCNERNAATSRIASAVSPPVRVIKRRSATGFDIFDLLLGAILIFVYGACFIISIVFTFFIDIYRNLDEKLNLTILSLPAVITSLDRNIDWFNDWLIEHNRIAGPILILLSAADLSLPFVLRRAFILL